MGQEGSSADKKSTFENEQKYLDKIKRLEE
jgi:hypothetical protein